MTPERKAQYIKTYMKMAIELSSLSKDPSSKFGAILVRPDMTIASVGYNGFPSLINDTEELLNDREAKLARVIHAEMNALTHSKDSSYKDYILIVNGHPCARCAAHIVNEKIAEVYYLYNEEFEKRWKESVELSKIIFQEGKVSLKALEYDI